MSVVSYLKLTPNRVTVKEIERYLEELTQLVRQQKGFISVEVLRPISAAAEFVILSEWESENDFKAWELWPRHRQIMDDYLERNEDGYSSVRMTRYK